MKAKPKRLRKKVTSNGCSSLPRKRIVPLRPAKNSEDAIMNRAAAIGAGSAWKRWRKRLARTTMT